MMNKLTQIKARNFQSGHLKVSELLDACLPAVFPKQEYILNNLKGLTPKNKILVRYYNKAFLPYRTRDTAWLARYFEQICDAYYVNNPRIPIKNQLAVKRLPLCYFESYIESSEKFDALRCQYEYNLASAYASITLNADVDDFYMKSFEKTIECCDPEYSELFRNRIIGAMKYLGVDSYHAEVGVEMCKGVWQDKVMAQTFANTFHLSGVNQLLSADGVFAKKMPRQWKKLVNLANILYARWSTLYYSEYQNQHRDIINHLGNIDNKKNLTKTEMKNLQNEVECLGFEYECLLVEAQQICKKLKNNSQLLDLDIKNSL